MNRLSARSLEPELVYKFYGLVMTEDPEFGVPLRILSYLRWSVRENLVVGRRTR